MADQLTELDLDRNLPVLGYVFPELWARDNDPLMDRFAASLQQAKAELAESTSYYPALSELIKRSLKPDGIALLHSIGRNRPMLMNAWIEKRIFPGAYPPSIGEFMELCEHSDFSVLDVENLRLHYAQTLSHWMDNF